MNHKARLTLAGTLIEQAGIQKQATAEFDNFFHGQHPTTSVTAANAGRAAEMFQRGIPGRSLTPNRPPTARDFTPPSDTDRTSNAQATAQVKNMGHSVGPGQSYTDAIGRRGVVPQQELQTGQARYVAESPNDEAARAVADSRAYGSAIQTRYGTAGGSTPTTAPPTAPRTRPAPPFRFRSS